MALPRIFGKLEYTVYSIVEHVDRTAASQPFPAKRRHGFGVRYGPYDWAGTATEVSGLSMDRPMSQVSQVYK